MKLSEIYLGLGAENLNAQLRAVSLGKLRTFQLFERFKTRLHVSKLNQDALRKVGPKIWARLGEGDEELAQDVSQVVLVSHLEMIVAVLNELGVPHNDGFFDKDSNVGQYLNDGWQARAWESFREKYPSAVLLFYLNHLAHEVDENAALFQP